MDKNKDEIKDEIKESLRDRLIRVRLEHKLTQTEEGKLVRTVEKRRAYYSLP